MSYHNKKTLKDLHLTERFLFAEEMEDPVISENMLEIIMEKDIHLLSRNETEKELRSSEFLDGATRIFVNTYGKNEEDVTSEFRELMQYINETREEVASRCKSSRIKEIHKRLEQIRLNEEVGVRWMQEWEEKLKIKKEAQKEGMEEGLRKGREEGREEGLEEGIKSTYNFQFRF